VFLDEALAEEPELAFSAGTHGDALVVETADYLQVATPVVGSFGAICRPWTMFRH
jgi:prolyl-tRNA editing enzyme YbaK/EbsC (Cys-tRNA(Pro) deacylase)